MELTALEVKKQLYKSKAYALFSHYVAGNLYYIVQLEDGTYQFPISVIEYNKETFYEDVEEDLSLDVDYRPVEVAMMSLSSDLGTTPFYKDMRGSELNRWIQMAIDAGEFIKLEE